MRIDRIWRLKSWLPLLSFILGYLFHYIISSKKDDSKFALQRHPKINALHKDVMLIVFIFSSVNNVSRRKTIRDTWVSNLSESVKYYFVISGGNLNEGQLTKELEDHNDLLIFKNIEDSFYSLTFKLLASLSWVNGVNDFNIGETDQEKTFNSYNFVLKCDDDSYVRVENILKELQMSSISNDRLNLYWGFFDGRAEVKKAGKYKEKNWVICDNYLPYALGGGYILGRHLVEFIASNAKQLKTYKSEDVSLGSWLAVYSNTYRKHDPRFDTEYISRGCHQSYLITHKHSENAIRIFHENIKKTGFLCKKEYRIRLSYVYDWTVPPSKCCNRSNVNIP